MLNIQGVERCQHHVLAGSRLRRCKLRHDYAEQRKHAWNLLPDKRPHNPNNKKLPPQIVHRDARHAPATGMVLAICTYLHQNRR